MRKLQTALAGLALTAGAARAVDIVTVEKVDIDKLQVQATFKQSTTVTVPVQRMIKRDGQDVMITEYPSQVRVSDAMHVFPITKGTFFDGTGKELEPAQAAKALRPGSMMISGGEELRAALKAKLFAPEAIVIIRDKPMMPAIGVGIGTPPKSPPPAKK